MNVFRPPLLPDEAAPILEKLIVVEKGGLHWWSLDDICQMARIELNVVRQDLVKKA